ncbi:MAG TPA: hypothetical protein VII72_18655 [Myxococcota bacterium]|jgi:hypothetical protein
MSSPNADPRGCRPSPPLDVDPDPIEQWLRWEEQANLPGFRTSMLPVDLPVAAIPAERLDVHLADAAPRELERRFFRRGLVLYPKHPLNTDASVAYFDEPASETWQARFTSSRTLVVAGAPGSALCSVKLPTDHPHHDFLQPEKTKLREEAEDALRWTSLFERVDAAIGPDPALLLIREMIAVMVPGSESGFLVRDLSPLQDGSFYLPALSLPWWGRQIASLHGAGFEEFWAACYAEAVGRAKAKLLTRYGLQYDTPNPQNLLVQLGRDLRPTGVIVLRDLGDLNPVAPLAAPAPAPWTRLHGELKPETQNSFWAFDSADEQRIPAATLERWYERHDLAYQAELRDFFLAGGPPPPGLAVPCGFEAWAAFLRSEAGADAIRQAFERKARAWRRRLSRSD